VSPDVNLKLNTPEKLLNCVAVILITNKNLLLLVQLNLSTHLFLLLNVLGTNKIGFKGGKNVLGKFLNNFFK